MFHQINTKRRVASNVYMYKTASTTRRVVTRPALQLAQSNNPFTHCSRTKRQQDFGRKKKTPSSLSLAQVPQHRFSASLWLSHEKALCGIKKGGHKKKTTTEGDGAIQGFYYTLGMYVCAKKKDLRQHTHKNPPFSSVFPPI